MLRDNLVGLIEPMLSSAGANPLALCTARKSHRTIDPHALKIPAPKGRNLTLTENAASPFHAEPRQSIIRSTGVMTLDICSIYGRGARQTRWLASASLRATCIHSITSSPGG